MENNFEIQKVYPKIGKYEKKLKTTYKSYNHKLKLWGTILVQPPNFNPIWLFGVLRPGGGGVPTAHNSKTIHGIEMKFGRVAENH